MGGKRAQEAAIKGEKEEARGGKSGWEGCRGGVEPPLLFIARAAK